MAVCEPRKPLCQRRQRTSRLQLAGWEFVHVALNDTLPFAFTDIQPDDIGIRHTERPAAAGIAPTVNSKGDSDDNALAGTINGPLQNRADPSASALENPRIGGADNPGMGVLVQPPQAARTHWVHSPGRS